MTEEERATAIEIFANDPRVQQLLNGQVYTIKDIGVWHTSRELKKLGAAMIVSLPTPLNVDFLWPLIDYDESESTSPPYEEHTVQVAMKNVNELVVSVDLNAARVVQIIPNGESQYEPPPDFTPGPYSGD